MIDSEKESKEEFAIKILGIIKTQLDLWKHPSQKYQNKLIMDVKLTDIDEIKVFSKRDIFM